MAMLYCCICRGAMHRRWTPVHIWDSAGRGRGTLHTREICVWWFQWLPTWHRGGELYRYVAVQCIQVCICIWHTWFVKYYCTHSSHYSSDVGPCEIGDIRLVGSRPNTGILEICFNETWGTVCDDAFEEPDVAVVCRQLGYKRGGVVWLYRSSIVFLLTCMPIGVYTTIMVPYVYSGVHRPACPLTLYGLAA